MALMTPQPGKLRDRLRFERRAGDQPDGYGNTDGDWQPLIEQPRRGRLLPVRGGDQVIADRAQGVSNWNLWVRYDPAVAGVAPGDRVVDTRDPSRVFRVTFAQDMDGSRAWILMQLELGKAVG